MNHDLTADDRRDYWTIRSDAGVALLLELEQVEPVLIPSDAPWVSGEVLRGYRVRNRDTAAAYSHGEENWATLGIADDLDRRILRHRQEAVVRRAHDAEGIRLRHPWHHCGTRCPHKEG